MIVITCAVPHESADLRNALGVNRAVTIAHTGIGTAAAERCVARLIAEHHPRLLISAGYAGALDPGIAHGELFLATNFTTAELLTRPNAKCGILTTQPRAAETAAEKAALARETGAQAVDMETSAIAEVCRARDVPLLSLRAISDTASAEIPVPLHVTYDLVRQRPRVAGLLAFLVRNPSRILPFARFVRGLTPAREAMTAEIIAVVENAAPPPSI
jgi:adenosylhomocysteine nucleosidase